MLARTTSTEHSHRTAARPFFSDFANTTPFFRASPNLQSKGNDDEFELAEKLTSTALPESALLGVAEAPTPPPPDDAPTDPSSSASTPAVQTKLTVGAADDHFEREADAIADRIVGGSDTPFTTPPHPGASSVQRQTPDEEAEGRETQETLQTKSGTEGEAPEAVQLGLELTRGSGSALPSSTQSIMEQSFGVEFSDVHVHTDVNAQAMNQELNARAFTYGSDIYFNAGEYQPETTGGRHLLAHELTHVVQQNPGLKRKPRDTDSAHEIGAAAGMHIQTSRSFGPAEFMPSGTAIHGGVLPLFAAENSGLFTEVKIPGANRRDVETGKVGVADFYKTTPTEGKARTIAINFDDGEPTYLKQDSKLDFGGGAYSHNKDAAPKGAKNTPKVRDAGKGPLTIGLGDLKPGNSAEALLGGPQVNNYVLGINNTARDIKSYLATHKDQSDGSGMWSPHPSALGKDELTIPPKLTYPGGAGMSRSPLAVYEDGARKVVHNSGLKGAMYVYKHDTAGVWVYEWIPETIPASTGSGEVDKVLKRLETEVIKPIQAKRKGNAPPLRAQEPRTLRAKKSTFPYAKWKGDYQQWKKNAKDLLGSEKEKDKGQILETLLEVEQRSGGKVGMPGEVKQRAKGYNKIQHWNRLGGIYGWLRNTFDGVYTKFKGVADKIKKKVSGLSRRLGGTSFGNWVKAAAKVIFKIFKMVGAWTVTQVMEKLIGSLQEGLSNNLRKLMEDLTPEGVKSKVELFEERKAEYEQLIKENEEELEKKIFGDKLALFDKLSEFEVIANQAGNIVTLVEWGVRILACAAPPAIGCLWNLAISALQAAFALLIQTCWFTKKVYAPVINTIEPVKRFPTEVAAFVVEKANSVMPLPEGFDPLFSPIVIDTGEFKPDCDDGSGPPLTPERQALLDLLEEVGEDKFSAMLEVIAKRGAGPWVLLTVERIQALKEPLGKVDLDELKAAAAAPDSGVPVPLEEFLASIGKYTKREQKLITEAKEAKEAKEDAKAGTGGKNTTGGPEYKDPLYTAPGAIDRDVTILFSALIPGAALMPGTNYPAPMDIYLVIGVADGATKSVVHLKNVSVKVTSVTNELVVFVNQKDFYAYYTDERFVSVLKGKELKIPKERLLNYE